MKKSPLFTVLLLLTLCVTGHLTHGETVTIEARGGEAPVNSLVFENHHLVGLGDKLSFSQDGLNWINIRIPFGPASEVLFSDGKWIVRTAYDGTYPEIKGALMSTVDLRHWKILPLDENQRWAKFTIFKGRMFLFAISSGEMWVGSELDNLELQELGFQLNNGEVLVEENKIHIIGNEIESPYAKVQISSNDGFNWFENDSLLQTNSEDSSAGFETVETINGIEYAVSRDYIYRKNSEQLWDPLWEIKVSNATDFDLYNDSALYLEVSSSNTLYLLTEKGRVLYTQDGENWSERMTISLPPQGNFTGSLISFDDTLIVCIGRNLYYQSDFDQPVVQTTNSLWGSWISKSTVYCNGKYFVAGSLLRVWSSDDGITWNGLTPIEAENWSWEDSPSLSLYTDPTTLYARTWGTWMMKTTDGINWEKYDTTLNEEEVEPQYHYSLIISTYRINSIRDMAYLNGVWTSSTHESQPIYSTDAIHWTSAPNWSGESKIFDVCVFKDKFIGVGDWMYHTENGMDWFIGYTANSVDADALWLYSVAAVSNQVFAWNSNRIFVSENGIEWAPVALPEEVPGIETYQVQVWEDEDGVWVAWDDWCFQYDVENKKLIHVSGVGKTPRQKVRYAPYLANAFPNAQVVIDEQILEAPQVELRTSHQLNTSSATPFYEITVKRFGPLEEPLTVTFQFSGNTKPGIDYELEGISEESTITFETSESTQVLQLIPIETDQESTTRFVTIYIEPSPSYRQSLSTQTVVLEL